MILHGAKKRFLKEVIRYYIETTECSYEDFIFNVQQSKTAGENPDYKIWLAVQINKLLTEQGVSLADCIENKDIIHSAIKADKSRQEGEFYTPEVWCKEGRKYLKDLLGDKWGEAYIWDASCYSMDTEILTKDNGWVRYSDLKDSDEVLSLNPDTLETEYVGFHTRFNKTADKFLVIEEAIKYHFSGYGWEDYIDLKVTLDHKMCVKIDGEIVLLSASDLYTELRRNFFTPEGKKASIFEIPVYTRDYENYSKEEVVRFIPLSYDACKIVDSVEDVWDITLNKNHVFLVRRNGKSCFSGNCGTGNLLATSDYPKDKIFMSTLLEEDAKMVADRIPGVTAFACDFVNGIDMDENNLGFSSKLPPKLIEVLKSDKPIVFYMNPPYKVMASNISDLGVEMGSKGMSKCALDIFHQFVYRIISLKRFYNLHNVYLGLFSPITLFHSEMLKPLYDDLKREFRFEGGMCFAAGDFSNTSESVDWIVGYTTWKTKQEGEQDRSMVLEAKAISKDNEDEVLIIGERLVRSVELNMHDWVKPKDIILKDKTRPIVTNFASFTGKTILAPANTLGWLMSSNFVIRGVRRCAITAFPNPDNIAITEENFWRCVASFATRRAYSNNSNPYNNCQYFNSPDTSIDGYQEWLYNGLILMLFDYNCHTASYRNIGLDGKPVEDLNNPMLEYWTSNNKLFPIKQEIVEGLVTDELLIQDIKNHPAENQFILAKIEEARPYLWDETLKLLEFGYSTILESLTGTVRKDLGYPNYTNAWDSSLTQLRYTKEIFTKNVEEKYLYLLSKLRDRLYKDIFKFGFLMDSAFSEESEDEDELLIDEVDE